MFFGGYRLVDFRQQNLVPDADPVRISRIYSHCSSFFVKRFIAVNLVIDNVEYAEVGCAIHKDDDTGNYIVEIPGYEITVASNDNVTIRKKAGEGGTTDYDELDNRPKINNVTLTGNKTSSDLSIQGTNQRTTAITDANKDNAHYPTNKAVADYVDAEGITKLDATKAAVANVGGLVVPSSAPSDTSLVAVGTGNDQEQVYIGAGLTLEGSTSPYTLKTVAASPIVYIDITINGSNEVRFVDSEVTVITIGNMVAAGKEVILRDGSVGSGASYYRCSYDRMSTEGKGKFYLIDVVSGTMTIETIQFLQENLGQLTSKILT